MVSAGGAAVRDGAAVAAASVAHVGIGEVFVIAGQSNSANHGEEKQVPKSGLVAAFDGKAWRLAEDPQPGASGNGGSFIPAFGDAMAARFGVPVGIVAAGAGGTSVREWLPKGARFPNPPTVMNNVVAAEGEWASKGGLFDRLAARIKPFGKGGIRAVLWHQGESDANQRDATRTLPGHLYSAYMEKLIGATRREAGWQIPWFVAQASYHTPDDPGSDDIRQAQAALWQSGVALQGPDTDALTGDLRDSGGQGVHFSAKGLRAHGAAWAQRVGDWLEAGRAAPPR
ncbi:MAG: sialate O-acetylesterase [Verrucomicrobiales bacterium]